MSYLHGGAFLRYAAYFVLFIYWRLTEFAVWLNNSRAPLFSQVINKEFVSTSLCFCGRDVSVFLKSRTVCLLCSASHYPIINLLQSRWFQMSWWKDTDVISVLTLEPWNWFSCHDMRKHRLWKMGLGYGDYKASSVSSVYDIDTRLSDRNVISWAVFLELNRIMPVENVSVYWSSSGICRCIFFKLKSETCFKMRRLFQSKK